MTSRNRPTADEVGTVGLERRMVRRLPGAAVRGGCVLRAAVFAERLDAASETCNADREATVAGRGAGK